MSFAVGASSRAAATPSSANLTEGTGRQPDIPNFDFGSFLEVDFGTSLITEQRRIQF
jgi:hypothetical protein